MESEVVGKRDGMTILAQTDELGSHCIISGKSHLMIHCRSHPRAVSLAKRIVKDGFWVMGRFKWPKKSFDINLVQFLQSKRGSGL